MFLVTCTDPPSDLLIGAALDEKEAVLIIFTHEIRLFMRRREEAGLPVTIQEAQSRAEEIIKNLKDRRSAYSMERV